MDNKRKEKLEYIKKSFELKNSKKYKEAIEFLYKALEFTNDSQEDNIELLSQIGDLHILLNNHERALDEFQKALSLNKNHTHSIQKCYEIYTETNQLNKALKIAQKMCEDNKTTQSYYNLINILIKLEKYQDAFEIFNSLDEKIKMDVDLLYLISTISKDKKKIILERIVEIDEGNEKANADLAEIEYNNKNYEKVIQYCINLPEDNPTALYYLAKIEANRQNHTKALDLLSKAIKTNQDKYDYYLDIAKVYMDISWLNEALMALKQSINYSINKNIKNDLDEKYFLSGWVLIKQNQPSKALLNLNAIDKKSNLYSKAQILIQTINLKNSNLSKALLELEKHSKFEQDNPILLDTLAATYKELKLNKKAIDTYKKALKYYPDSIYYTLELIDLLIDEKKYEEAFKYIEKFNEKNKNCASIYNSLARIYYRLSDLNKALESINVYLKLDENKAESHYFKGLILNDLQNYEEAKDSIYTAIRINPSEAKYYSQMARSYFALKEYENALLYAKEAIEINPNEINYKKQAYEVSLSIGNESQIQMYRNQLQRSEKILKMKK